MSVRCAQVLGPHAVKVLLVRERLEGFFLERLDEDGGVLGATQYETMDDAMREAYSEYGALSDWAFCPEDVNPVQYLRARPDS
jgi:hypothetical protein